MKICTLSAIAILSLTAVISYSTVIGMVAQPASQRIERIDFYYGYGHGPGRFSPLNPPVSDESDSEEQEESSPVVVKTLDGATVGGGARPMKNKVKGPADLGVYYINSAGRSCGGLSTSQCSTSCGALGYPVYWCYPKVCFCHYGTAQQDGDDSNDLEPPNMV